MIDEREIRAALERPLDGDQEACERAWRVVSAAAPGTRTARSPRRGSRPRLLGALGAAVLLAVLAATPPGTAVSEWVQDGLGVRDTPEHTPSSDELRAPPGGGELLVGSAGATWVVRGDGSRRRLGPYRAASWSPNSRRARRGASGGRRYGGRAGRRLH